MVSHHAYPNSPASIGSLTAPHHLEAFQKLCQDFGIAPQWEVFEVEGVVPNAIAFGARVHFRGRVIGDQEPYPSKRAARDAVAERALVELNDLIKAEGWRGVNGNGGGNSNRDVNGDDDGREGSRGAAATRGVGEENWIGMLQEKCQVAKWMLPRYEFFEQEAQFFCEATLVRFPDQVFGSKDSRPFVKKKDAQRNAAREAVLWLRTNDLNEQAGRRNSTGSGATDYINPSSYTEAPRGAFHPASPPASSPGPSIARSWHSAPSEGETGFVPFSASSPSLSPDTSWHLKDSYAAQVQKLCFKLKISPPRYIPEPALDSKEGTYARTYAFFDDTKLDDNDLAVYNIFGKRTAKQECAKRVLAHLQKIEAEREPTYSKVSGRMVRASKNSERPMERLKTRERFKVS